MLKESESNKETAQPNDNQPTTVTAQSKEDKAAEGTDTPKVLANGPSPAQLRAIENLAKRRGIDADKLEDLCQQQFGTGPGNLTAEEASTFIRNLQQSA